MVNVEFDGSGNLLLNGQKCILEDDSGYFLINGLSDGTNSIDIKDIPKIESNGDLKIANGTVVNKGRYIGTAYQYETTSRNFTTTYADGMVGTNYIKEVGSDILFSFRLPMRNDSGSWGGGYIDIFYSINNGSSWVSLGTSGYDGGVMQINTNHISSYGTDFWVDLDAVRTASQVRFKFKLRSYDGTLWTGGSHNIQATGELGIGESNMSITEVML